MSERAKIFLELYNGRLHEQELSNKRVAVIVAKSFRDKYGPEIKWLCVYTNEEVLYEHHSTWYQELLETLYFRNPNKKADEQYYKNLLSDLSIKNPILFDKYLDWIHQIKSKNKKSQIIP